VEAKILQRYQWRGHVHLPLVIIVVISKSRVVWSADFNSLLGGNTEPLFGDDGPILLLGEVELLSV